MIRSSSSRTSKLHWSAARPALTAAILLMLAIALPAAQAQTFTTLYSFQGPPDGGQPEAGVVSDESGNLYGTTFNGGDSLNCWHGCGTVFKLDPAGNETVLHSFDVHDGTPPLGGVLRDKLGNLYGTAAVDGNFTFCPSPSGCGTVFQLDPTGRFRVLHYFHGQPLSGAVPEGGLIFENGSLYGVTNSGGDSISCPFGCGTVYAMDLQGNETVLHSFTGNSDGEYPAAELVSDGAGNFYGTTGFGGTSGLGTVFKVDATGNEMVLYSFTGGSDGGYLGAGLCRDAGGNLYGTTNQGGVYSQGTVFMLDTSGNKTVLHSFTGGTDGAGPRTSLVRDAAGNLYGTAFQGGDAGMGTVFMLTASRKFKVLHSFRGRDGRLPQGRLLRDRSGNLYGTTWAGGAFQRGTVFKITP